MDYFKCAKWSYIAISAAMIIAGILFIAFPSTSAVAICYAVGILITLFGAIKLISYFSNDMFRLAFQFDLALGIFSVVAGVLIILHPGNIAVVMPVIIGVFVLVDGALKIQTSHDARLFGLVYWWGILVFGILSCICGLLLILNPFEGASALMILLGISLIADGIQNIWITAYTAKFIKKKDYIDAEFHNIDD